VDLLQLDLPDIRLYYMVSPGRRVNGGVAMTTTSSL
jgi:hypothetical protein